MNEYTISLIEYISKIIEQLPIEKNQVIILQACLDEIMEGNITRERWEDLTRKLIQAGFDIGFPKGFKNLIEE